MKNTIQAFLHRSQERIYLISVGRSMAHTSLAGATDREHYVKPIQREDTPEFHMYDVVL